MFSSSKAGRVYNALLERTDRVVSTREIKEMCKLLKVDFNSVLVGLTRSNALEPVIFKGVYYLRNREERDLGTTKEDPLSIVARACNLKLKKNWYFGLATALQLAGLWEQQTLTTITVVSKKRISRPKTVSAGMRVEFKQLTNVPFDKLVRQRGTIRFSEPSRTILDYAYFNARNKESLEYAKTIFKIVAEKAGGEEKLLKQAKPLISKYPGLYVVFLKKFFGVKQA